MMAAENPLPLMRQRSREASVAGVPCALHAAGAPAPAPSPPCSNELAACTKARGAHDLEGCMAAARAALKKDAACGKAWAFLCWALFELRRYDEARAECRRALAHREWALRDREGMAALRASCLLLSELSPTVGDRLRDGWYQKRLRVLYEAGELHAYTTEAIGRTDVVARTGVDEHELSLLDNVPSGGLRDVCMGGDGGERDVPEGLLTGGDPDAPRPRPRCLLGPNFPAEQALGGVVYLKSAILPFHCDRRLGAHPGPPQRQRRCYAGGGPCLRCVCDGFPEPTHRFPTWAPTPMTPVGASHVQQPHPQMDVFHSTDRCRPPRSDRTR